MGGDERTSQTAVTPCIFAATCVRAGARNLPVALVATYDMSCRRRHRHASRDLGHRPGLAAPSGNCAAVVTNSAGFDHKTMRFQHGAKLAVAGTVLGVDPADQRTQGRKKLNEPIQRRLEGQKPPVGGLERGEWQRKPRHSCRRYGAAEGPSGILIRPRAPQVSICSRGGGSGTADMG